MLSLLDLAVSCRVQGPNEWMHEWVISQLKKNAPPNIKSPITIHHNYIEMI